MGTKQKKKKLPVLFISICVIPTVVLTLIFKIYPTANTLVMSFTDANLLGSGKFVALDNYAYMFQDKYFILALKNTLKLLAVVSVVTIAFSLILAFILTQSKLREAGIYRTVFYIPNVISLSVIAVIWAFIFNARMGILNNFLDRVGLGMLKRDWLGDSNTALWCIGVVMIWQAVGYYMIMHIAAIDGISREIYEAATIDGAGKARQLLSITVPLIKNIIGRTFILAVSGTLGMSLSLDKVMTGGGPNGASSVLTYYMYRQGMMQGNYGYAMAITVFTLIMSLGLSLLTEAITEKE
ncbi:carbohydrate ABC transporter permease [uncultured Acetatifactor sp.]|uniref:carbohydrate ABC transporter permease n=1 Tax=uncultured Acetatifactor sp. TaxID=1671927 RepID=UPI0026320D77|nr:sugar ABC transporter permease [uncultured Acetatifactor sp.]